MAEEPMGHVIRSARAARAIRGWAGLLLWAGVLTGCRTGINYTDGSGPVSRLDVPGASPCATRNQEDIRVVSFNVEFALQVDSAAALLSEHSELRCADVYLLQEMDAFGTQRLAEALGTAFVYYPAVFHLRYERDFGNAVLSRWPIIEEEMLILPHVALATRTQRTATAVTVVVGSDTVRAYSAHLGTMLEIGPGARRDQLLTILIDATRYDRVVLGGDMNSGGVGNVVAEAGFDWPTREGPATLGWGRRWDHIFSKGLALPDSGYAGTLPDSGGASDHRPVWVRLKRGLASDGSMKPPAGRESWY